MTVTKRTLDDMNRWRISGPLPKRNGFARKQPLRLLGGWLVCALASVLGCSPSEPNKKAAGEPQILSVQIDNPTCRKTTSDKPVIIAQLKNNSHLLLLRLDVEVVLARHGQLAPLAKAEHTLLFPSGVGQDESEEIQIRIEQDSIHSLLERSDLELMLRPTRIHVSDRSGNVHVSDLRGLATIVVRDWMDLAQQLNNNPRRAHEKELR